MSKLKKDLNAASLFAIATGTTLSSGFFLLPGLAAREAGPAVVLSYILAALFLIPGVLSVIELATAMPRAGGAYYFLDRSLGPLVGSIGGFAAWLVLVFKTAFALIGMGAYLTLIVPGIPIEGVAALLAVVFGAVNLFGARAAGSAQVALVVGLLVLLVLFIGNGIVAVDFSHFQGFFDKGADAIIGTAGMVYVSYVGITHVASVSEEVERPEKTLPIAVLGSIATVIVIYALGVFVVVGVVPQEILVNDLTPIATAARMFAGSWGVGLVIAAALLAFSSVANAGVLSASRYPLAVSRDGLLPDVFSRSSPSGIPVLGVVVTVSVIVVAILLLDVASLAKFASALQLLVLAFLAGAVIVMRESEITSYDPSFHAPFYPWMQIAGIFGPLWLIGEMGWLAIVPAMGFSSIAVAWYIYYARDHVTREGAIYHIFERLGRRRFDGLDRELRVILKEKGAREEDPFEQVVMASSVLDQDGRPTFEAVVQDTSRNLARTIGWRPDEILVRILAGTRYGATPVAKGVALPHVHLPELERPVLVIARIGEGVRTEPGDSVWGEGSERIFAVFLLASPEAEPALHLRILAELARRVDVDSFLDGWLAARDEHDLKETLLREERFHTIVIDGDRSSAHLVDCPLKDARLPEGCLATLIRRDGRIIVPSGRTVLKEGDRVTVIGDPTAIASLRRALTSA